MYEFLPFVFMETQKQHVTITDLQATSLHGVAAHRNLTSYWIFLCVVTCQLSLRIKMNHTENVAELLVQARTVEPGAPLQFLSSTWEW